MEPDLKKIFGSYMPWKITDNTWVISFMEGSEFMYLLEGEEKALLLDTGYAVGNLRTFVEGLTDKEILVCNTHFHPDHAGGNGEFERVYMSENYKKDEMSVTNPGAGPFDINDLPYPDYEKVLIGDGYVFDLGGRKVEVHQALHAHCNSSLFFLDRDNRMVFVGDDCESMQVILYDNSGDPVQEANYDVKEVLANHQANMKWLLDRMDTFDYVFPNHNGTPIAKSFIQDHYDLIDEIYAGTAPIEDDLHHPYIAMDPRAKEFCRVRGKKSSIFIKKAEVLKVYGK